MKYNLILLLINILLLLLLLNNVNAQQQQQQSLMNFMPEAAKELGLVYSQQHHHLHRFAAKCTNKIRSSLRLKYQNKFNAYMKLKESVNAVTLSPEDKEKFEIKAKGYREQLKRCNEKGVNNYLDQLEAIATRLKKPVTEAGVKYDKVIALWILPTYESFRDINKYTLQALSYGLPPTAHKVLSGLNDAAFNYGDALIAGKSQAESMIISAVRSFFTMLNELIGMGGNKLKEKLAKNAKAVKRLQQAGGGNELYKRISVYLNQKKIRDMLVDATVKGVTEGTKIFGELLSKGQKLTVCTSKGATAFAGTTVYEFALGFTKNTQLATKLYGQAHKAIIGKVLQAFGKFKPSTRANLNKIMQKNLQAAKKYARKNEQVSVVGITGILRKMNAKETKLAGLAMILDNACKKVFKPMLDKLYKTLSGQKKKK